MSAYAPTSLAVVASYGLLFLLVTAVVRLIELLSFQSGKNQTALAWVAAAITCASASVLSFGQPAGIRMIAIIMSTLVAIKAVSLARRRVANTLRVDRWLTFVWLWPAMQPKPFSATSYKPLPGAKSIARHGAIYVALGVATVKLAQFSWTQCHATYLSEALALVGISLCLHFGFLNILTGGLRFVGVDVKPLFVAPLKSKSLREFWGERWNLAFNDMTARFVLMPIARLTNVETGIVASFAFSGLLHEMAISLPAQAGFGLPMVYFLLHGTACVVERELGKRKINMGNVLSRVWTIGWVLIPLHLVFHSAFLNSVVWPIIKA